MHIRSLPLIALAICMAGCFETQRIEQPVPVRRRKIAPPKPSVRWITPEQAFKEIQDDPDLFLLCVADKEEYDRGHIAGSVIIPVMGLERGLDRNDWWPDINFGRVPRRDQRILCYCWWKSCDCPSVPTYSQLARKILIRKGFRKIDIIVGGMRDWMKKGLPVEKTPPSAEKAPDEAQGRVEQTQNDPRRQLQ